MGFWDKFGTGDRFKFVQPGDTIEGEILSLSVTDFGGQSDPVPVLVVRTREGDREVTASQAVLCSRLAEAAPEVGDSVKITYDGDADKARPGRSPAKLFTVIVKRSAAPTPPPPSAPRPPAADDDSEPF